MEAKSGRAMPRDLEADGADIAGNTSSPLGGSIPERIGECLADVHGAPERDNAARFHACLARGFATVAARPPDELERRRMEPMADAGGGRAPPRTIHVPAPERRPPSQQERTMSIRIDGKDLRIGLALSGGGFRATAFHLGVFRRLQAMGLLWKLDLLSCVSGGSIAGAYLAANWGDDDALERLDRYLRSTSIAVASVVAGALNPFDSRIGKLADSYDRDLFGKKTLGQLDGGPRLYLNATNLASGNMFFFVTGERKGAEMGEHELGTKPADGFLLSRAVAASSAFPPVFPPLKLGRKDYDVPDVDYVTLTDGGVYDNLGANPLFRARNALDYAIVSDAGKPFEIDERPTEWGAIALTAALGITMEQIRGLQFKRLELSCAAHMKPKPLWFSIDSREGEAQAGDAAFASAIGTNLRKLPDAEMAVLARHAAALFDSRLDRYAPELARAT